jgi:hypothetical protein
MVNEMKDNTGKNLQKSELCFLYIFIILFFVWWIWMVVSCTPTKNTYLEKNKYFYSSHNTKSE